MVKSVYSWPLLYTSFVTNMCHMMLCTLARELEHFIRLKWMLSVFGLFYMLAAHLCIYFCIFSYISRKFPNYCISRKKIKQKNINWGTVCIHAARRIGMIFRQFRPLGRTEWLCSFHYTLQHTVGCSCLHSLQHCETSRFEWKGKFQKISDFILMLACDTHGACL